MKTKMTVTVYNPVGEVASTAVMELTADEAARLVSKAHENGVRCEVMKFEAKEIYAFRITKVVEIEAASVEAAIASATLLVEERGDVKLI